MEGTGKRQHEVEDVLGISFLEQRCPVDVRLGTVHVHRAVTFGWQAVVHFDFDPFAPLPEAKSEGRNIVIT